jgi:hypothetical protein
MKKTKRMLAAVAAADGPKCEPGQHGNPGPGFKPALCPPPGSAGQRQITIIGKGRPAAGCPFASLYGSRAVGAVPVPSTAMASSRAGTGRAPGSRSAVQPPRDQVRPGHTSSAKHGTART